MAIVLDGTAGITTTAIVGLSSPLSVSVGGTGASTLTANSILQGNGTNNIAAVAPGTSGNVLISTGSVWSSSVGLLFHGPTSVGSGSTVSHGGVTTISSSGNYSGVYYYTNFTLNSGVTMTVPAGKGRLIIYASSSIIINGTISAVGAGLAPGGSGGTYANYLNGGTLDGSAGSDSTDQAGGGGGGSGNSGQSGNGGNGGNMSYYGYTIQSGGTGSGLTGGAATSVTGSSLRTLTGFLDSWGGASGGGGGSGAVSGGTGGRGGGIIVLCAPSVTFGSTATITAAGAAGGAGTTDGGVGGGGGGGGGGGAIIVITKSFTDNGATITAAGGAGGAAGGGSSPGSAGGAGAAGVKQILVYN